MTTTGYHSLMHIRPRGAARAAAARAATALIALVLFAASAAGAVAAPLTAAGDVSTPPPAALAALRSSLLRSVGSDRAAAGLRALRQDPALNAVAEARAERLAGASEFSHAAAGPGILTEIASAGVQPRGAGEVLGWSAYPGYAAALDSIHGMWLASPSHRAILLSAEDNYIGVGVAMSGAKTFATVVVAETRDRTAPVVRLHEPRVDGSTVTFSWTATDPLLQTHTAGLRSVAVQVRQDDGPWRSVRPGAGASSITLRDRASGHTWWVRVRASDGAGNVSRWTTPRSVDVP
jgi:uncharacterized protein YkwD